MKEMANRATGEWSEGAASTSEVGVGDGAHVGQTQEHTLVLTLLVGHGAPSTE